MNADSKPWGEESESAYLRHLEHERHMFTWCWVRYGDASPEQARELALLFYAYEEPNDSHRGLAFHDEAWHWALLRIVGERYWLTRPELESPSAAYCLESDSFESASGTQLINQADR